MKKQEYLIPCIALVLAVILGVYLVASNRGGETDSATSDVATTTTATTTDAGSNVAPAARRPLAEGPHYAYGPVTLSLNQAAGFSSGLSLRPVSVVEDSRCPINARCIRAGTVKLLVRTTTNTYTENAQTELVTLSLNEVKTIGTNTVTLEEVVPAVEAGSTFESSDYRFTIRVTGDASHGEGGSSAGQCYVGGCSSQLCTDTPNAVSTCEYRAEYGCYRAAKCERQTDGKCGWTPTPELTRCLANPQAIQ